MIYSGTLFVMATILVGPPISGVVLSIFLSVSSVHGNLNFLSIIMTAMAFAISSYFVGFLPALLASFVVVWRRRVSFAEALTIALLTTFLLFFAVAFAFNRLTEPANAAGLGLALALISVPGAIGSGLVAAWWGAFSPSVLAGEGSAAPFPPAD